jgi:hypothetical protein
MSRLIRKIMRSPASHTYVVFEGLWGKDWVIEATTSGLLAKGGIQTIPYDSIVGKRIIVSEHTLLETGSIDGQLGLRATVNLFGKTYDKWGAVGLGLCVLGRRFGCMWKNDLDNPDKYYCTETTMNFIQGSMVPGFEDFDPKTQSHEVLRQMVLDSQHFQQVDHPKHISWWRRLFGKRESV